VYIYIYIYILEIIKVQVLSLNTKQHDCKITGMEYNKQSTIHKS